MLGQKNKDEAEGTTSHFPLYKTKENGNLSPQPRLCSFVLTQFERGLLEKAARFCKFWILSARPVWRSDFSGSAFLLEFA